MLYNQSVDWKSLGEKCLISSKKKVKAGKPVHQSLVFIGILLIYSKLLILYNACVLAVPSCSG